MILSEGVADQLDESGELEDIGVGALAVVLKELVEETGFQDMPQDDGTGLDQRQAVENGRVEAIHGAPEKRDPTP